MGVGTNVQNRAIALHHIDCPWRPADLEQREGRLLRQGNQNPEVRIIRYVTEGSFDVFSWQTVERKAAFINQVMRGEVTERSIDDVGDQALSYAEVKALATGNSLIMEKAGVEAELTKLERLQGSHRQEQANLARRVAGSDREAAEQEALAAAYRSAALRVVDTSGDRFKMIIDGHQYRKRTDAAQALQAFLVAAIQRVHRPESAIPVGELAGFDLVARITRDSFESSVRLSLDGIPRSTPAVSFAELRETPALGMLTRVENLTGDLDSRATAASERAERALKDSARASSRIGQPFEHGDRITGLKTRLAEIEKELAPPPEPEPSDVAASPPSKTSPLVQILASARKAAITRQWDLSTSASTAASGVETPNSPGLTL